MTGIPSEKNFIKLRFRNPPWLFLLELVIFAQTCWALYSTVKTNLAIAFGVIYMLNKILMVI
jgi:hypothetical protein